MERIATNTGQGRFRALSFLRKPDDAVKIRQHGALRVFERRTGSSSRSCVPAEADSRNFELKAI